MNKLNFYLNKDIFPSGDLLSRIQNIAQWEGVWGVSVFPDLHLKSDELVPTGTVFATDRQIYPTAIKSNFNCGISVISTDLKYSRLKRSDVEFFFEKLVEVYRQRDHSYWKINKSELDKIIFFGVDWIKNKFGLGPQNQANIENNGSFFKGTDFSFAEVKRNIPFDAYVGGIAKLGIMWVGNHFLEMNRVEKISDKETAGLLGIEEDQIIFMIHGEPGSFGPRIGKYFLATKDMRLTNKLRKAFYHFSLNPRTIKTRKYLYNWQKIPPAHLRADSKEARKYISCAYAAINYGFVNRTLAYKVITDILAENTGSDVRSSILIDVAHKIIRKENLAGKEFWVHRNGASRALGPSHLKDHPVYGKTGQPLPIPCSMLDGSYLCVATDKVSEALFSVNHGTGRKISREILKKTVTNQNVYDMLSAAGIHLKQFGKGDINQQSPVGYKDLDMVLRIIEGSGLVKPVARLRPVGVLKG